LNPRWLCVLVAVALSGLPGCCTQTPVAAPRVNEPGAVATSAAAARVSIVEAGFVPRAVTVKVGESVTWTNNDSAKHNVGGSDLVSGVILPGAAFTHTFDQASTYQYLCTFHPDTEGLVEVVPR